MCVYVRLLEIDITKVYCLRTLLYFFENINIKKKETKHNNFSVCKKKEGKK